jgi:ABC-type transport system substrate-binding protein
MVVDRIEWITIPDPATAAAALQNGEVDWCEIALPDLVPILKKNRNVTVDIQDPLGSMAYLQINHLFPPFNDVRARRAILMAISQEEYMRAYVGDDDRMWKPLPGYFTPGTPLYTEEGGEILKGPRKLDAAKRLLAESGYAGEPVILMAAQDQAGIKAWGDVTADLLKSLGIKVDYAAVDWGTVVARRAGNLPPPKAVGRCSSVPGLALIALLRPMEAFAPTAIRRASDGQTFRKSRRRLRLGTTRRPSMRRRQPCAGLTRLPSIMWSMRRSAFTSGIKLGERTSPVWGKGRCRSSGG